MKRGENREDTVRGKKQGLKLSGPTSLTQEDEKKPREFGLTGPSIYEHMHKTQQKQARHPLRKPDTNPAEEKSGKNMQEGGGTE